MEGSGPGRRPILFNGDMAVLESGEARKDLDCTVTPLKALLGFDMKFHAGYDVSIPLKELTGPANMLSIVFRVVPDGKNDPVYFGQQFRVPTISDASGAVTLPGNFDVGEGSYRVDWLMRDFAGRFCSTSWTVDAALSSKDSQIRLALPPLAVAKDDTDQFGPEPPVHRSAGSPLDVKLMVNFAPAQVGSAALDPADTLALVSILRGISRAPQIGKFSLVVFNLQDQDVLYTENAVDHIDFPALGQALRKLSLGTVAASQLTQKNGDVEFLSSLIRKETSGGPNPDALVFVSPKTVVDAAVPQDDLRQIGDLKYPVFYMNYDANPLADPWRDVIGRMVKFFRGREYTISAPHDLWNALTEMVSKTIKSRQERAAASPDTPGEEDR